MKTQCDHCGANLPEELWIEDGEGQALCLSCHSADPWDEFRKTSEPDFLDYPEEDEEDESDFRDWGVNE